MSGTWIQTATGLRVNPLSMKPEDVDIADIAHALANLCRFTGHTREFYSVAQHSVLVSRLLERWGCDPWVQLWGLMHDAAEAYLGDVASPMKRYACFMFALDGVPQSMSFERVEREAMTTIAVAYDLPLPVPPVVKEADSQLLSDEAAALIGNCTEWDLSCVPGEMSIDPVSPADAVIMFMERWDALYPQLQMANGSEAG